MTVWADLDPGFLAVSREAVSERIDDLSRIAMVIGAKSPTATKLGDRTGLVVWGLSGDQQGARTVYPLSRGTRMGETDLSLEAVGALAEQSTPSAAVVDVMPPFAALRTTELGEVMSVTDSMGARHVYHCRRGDGFGVSTNAAALAMALGSSLDPEAVAVQSMLGWQLGSRTLFDGVQKVPARSFVNFDGHEATVGLYAADTLPPPRSLDRAVNAAAATLRTYLNAYLDDHPDATLQLTGGQDSRILLSAIPPSRRRGLRAMTLSVPGSEDAAIAAAIADSYGMEHRIITLDGIDDWTPTEAYDRVRSACRRLGCMADPLALAALLYAEGKIEQGPRISGLGGEVARGFYYVFPSLRIPVAARTVSQLADWRMFANESVAAAALEPLFHDWAREFAHQEVLDLLSAGGTDDIRSSSDEFYLSQRMQRWAGLTDSATCFERDVVNPMLDRRFLDIARGLLPADKRNSRFLSRLQVELDSELADVHLDGRPPPRAYAARTFSGQAMRGRTLARRGWRKSTQRLSGARKPPAGGDAIALKVVDYWREHPDVLGSLEGDQFIRSDWVDGVLGGVRVPDSATTSFVMNLIVARDGLGDRAAHK